MESIINYTVCPVCGNPGIKPVLKAIDQTVSKKEFAIWECNHCSLRFTQNVPDAASITYYYKSEEYISHTDSNKGIINRLYRFVRHITLKQKRKSIEKITRISKGRLLDIGSGAGVFVSFMKYCGWDVTGLEPHEDARAVAKKQYGILLQDTSELENLKPGSFDAITLWHVLEHVHELDAFIIKLKNLLKPNGVLFIAVPNYRSLDADIYKEYWAAYDVPRHLYHLSPEAVQFLMGKHGLKISEYKPMWFDSFYISLLSSKYKSGSAKIFSAAWNGLRSNFYAMKDVKKCSSVIYIIKK